ncbi:MAG: Beta-barrel assembly-enhancing protease [Myxococcota bacterium]|nr:Beta-barrel assembly-enhancing protease [Myxococcota bacterium]
MALDKVKIEAAAQKLIQKGQYDKAISELQKLVKESPKDVRNLQKIGDIQAKKGDHNDAIETYLQVAAIYNEQGFAQKAIAVHKQILRLDPTRIDVNELLANMYQQLNLLSDAMEQFQQIANYYESKGNKRKALESLKKLVELEPNNLTFRLNLADLYIAADMEAEALDCLQQAAKILKKASKMEEYARVSERILHMKPDDAALQKELVQMYMEQHNYQRALKILTAMYGADPLNPDTLQTMARVFVELDQKHKAAQIHKELAKYHQGKGSRDEQLKHLVKARDLNPNDGEVTDLIQQLQGGPPKTTAPAPKPKPASAVAQPASPPPAQKKAPEPEPPAPIALDPPSPPPAAKKASAPAGPATTLPSGPASPGPVGRPATRGAKKDDEDKLARMITETDVYLKYGLKEKAFEHLEKILAIDPEYAPGIGRRGEAHRKAGDTAAAVADFVSAANKFILKFNLPEAKRYADLAAELEPADPAVALLLSTLGASPPGPAEEPAIIPPAFPEPGIPEPFEPPPAVEPSVPEAPAPPPPPPAMPHISLGSLPGIESIPEAEQVEEVPADASASPGMSAEDFESSFLGMEPAVTMPVSPPVPPAAPAPVPAPPTANRLPTGTELYNVDDLQKFAADTAPKRETTAAFNAHLEEADFFESQGLISDAIDMLQKLQVSHPEHRGVQERLHRLTARPMSFGGVDLNAVQAEPAPAPGPAGEIQFEPPAEVLPAAGTVQSLDAAPSAEPAVPSFDIPFEPPPGDVSVALPSAADLSIPDQFTGAGKIPAAEMIDAVPLPESTPTPPPEPSHPSVVARADAATAFDLGAELDQELAAGSEKPKPASSTYPERPATTVKDFMDAAEEKKPKPLNAEEQETHFNLGIAYREMGLHDDAMREFKLVEPYPQWTLQSRMNMGFTMMDAGDPLQAATWFGLALAQPNLTRDETVGLNYEVAAAYESADNTEKAKQFFEKVVALDPGFRDAAERLQALKEGRKKSGEPMEGGGDDIDAALDNLLG